MCDIIEYGRGAPKNIVIEFQRDASMRSTEVFITAISRSGAEQGLKLIISDKGEFIRVGKPVDLIEGVDVVI